MRREEVEAKEETVYESVFIHLNTSRECSLFLLNKLFTLLCVIPSVLLAASSQIASSSHKFLAIQIRIPHEYQIA